VPPEVKKIYANKNFKFDRHYIIPTPFDPRLIVEIPLAVAQAAMKSGVARHHIKDFGVYKK